MLRRRFLDRADSEYVFHGPGGRHHKVDSDHVIEGVAEKAECPFILHDLRRTFLTVAERLALSYMVLKKLANPFGRNDTTFGYIVVDVKRLREPMQKITNEFLRFCNAASEEQKNLSEQPSARSPKQTSLDWMVTYMLPSKSEET